MKFAFGVEYLGTHYSGWQFQGHSDKTIQAYVQAAFSFVANHEVTVKGSGRTDSGVHALLQIGHFESSAVRTDFSWRQGANTQLPRDIRIKWVQQVDSAFHARFKALYRDYIYMIQHTLVPSALWGHQVTSTRVKLNVDAMAQAVTFILGEHDFSAFRAAGCQASHPVRHILEANVWQKGDYIAFAVRGNAFLHHMVRNIVGSLILVGAGEQSLQWFANVLQGRDRSLAGPTAPANGLYFRNTQYAPRWGLPSFSGTPYGLFDKNIGTWPLHYDRFDFGDRL